MTSERSKWEERYQDTSFEPREEPSAYLADRLAKLSDGRALDAATGTGRNARLLENQGYVVDAVDISREALERAAARSIEADNDGAVNWIQADLSHLPLRRQTYAVVAVSFFYGPGAIPELIAALERGGVLVYEHHVTSNAEDLRGPSRRYRYEPDELLDLCRSLRIVDYQEGERIDDDGRVSAMVRMTAVRPNGD